LRLFQNFSFGTASIYHANFLAALVGFFTGIYGKITLRQEAQKQTVVTGTVITLVKDLKTGPVNAALRSGRLSYFADHIQQSFMI
jgi:hypothetical protein